MKITDLIEDIYDAALEPARWSDVVVGINKFVGGRACGIFSKDSISKSGVTHYYCGADPHYIQLYSDTHSKFDPLDCLPPLGRVVSIPDLVAFDEYRHGRFYQEWLRPQGCVDAANVVLENSNPHCPVLLTVLAGKHMVDDDMRQRIAQIVPHAHRSLMINRIIDTRRPKRRHWPKRWMVFAPEYSSSTPNAVSSMPMRPGAVCCAQMIFCASQRDSLWCVTDKPTRICAR